MTDGEPRDCRDAVAFFVPCGSPALLLRVGAPSARARLSGGGSGGGGRQRYRRFPRNLMIGSEFKTSHC